MRFFRHLSAVMLVVAVVVGLGMLWAHASGGGPRQPPPPQVAQRLTEIKSGAISVQPDTGFHLADTSNLIRTCEIEAALAAVVITVSAVRRRRRSRSRTRMSAGGGSMEGWPINRR